MAATFEQERLNRHGEDGVLAVWDFDAAGQDGATAEIASFTDRSVQVSGTFGGTTVTIEGSNNGTTWVTLTDTAGTALTFTSAGLRQILQVTRYIRAKTTSGTGVSVKAALVALRKG